MQRLNEPKKKRRIILKSMKDTRKLLSSVVNQLNNDEITSDKARAFTTVINSFLRTYEVIELENRLQEIQNKLNQKNNFTADDIIQNILTELKTLEGGNGNPSNNRGT